MAMSPEQKKAAITLAWNTGNLTYLKRPIQRKIEQDWIKSKQTSRKFVMNCSRRLGKSTFLFIKAIEQCLKQPDTYVAYVAPVNKGLEAYLSKIDKKVLKDCPRDLTPEISGNNYTFPNGSRIECAGSNNKSYNNLRGNEYHLALVDEGAYVDDLVELIDDVLMPALFNTKGYLLLSSTPPPSPAHPFVKYLKEAQTGGYSCCYTIYDAGYDIRDIEDFAREAGGKDSATFKREYLAQIIVDTNYAIIPEWDDKYTQSISKDEWFQYYLAYTSLDIGVRDNTALLFAYFNFKLGKLIIEDELILSGDQVRTDIIASLTKKREAEYLPKKIIRWSDNNNLVLLNDLSVTQKLTFNPTNKDSLEAMVNKVRVWVSNGKIVINPRCVNLIGCLKYGVWNRTKTEFDRADIYGHFDALASLMYMVRNVDDKKNPIPAHVQYIKDGVLTIPEEVKMKSRDPLDLRRRIVVPKRDTDNYTNYSPLENPYGD